MFGCKRASRFVYSVLRVPGPSGLRSSRYSRSATSNCVGLSVCSGRRLRVQGLRVPVRMERFSGAILLGPSAVKARIRCAKRMACVPHW
jgi:hypothetical protein